MQTVANCLIQMNKMRPDVVEREIIREIFSKILQLEKGDNYVVPFERYMKKYKLNGYYSKKYKHTLLREIII